MELKTWPHPAGVAAFIEVKEYDDKTIQIHKDGSKSEQGVGAGVSILWKWTRYKIKYKLDNRCSNNQAEQLAIAKALEALETTHIEEKSPRTAAIITGSRISLDSIKNVNNYKFLVVLITNDSYTNEETKIRIRLSKPTMAILTKTNNQAEQLAIAKALEALEMIDIEENSPCTAAIITDTRISLDSIKNVNNHSYLIEEIGRGYLNWRVPTGQ